MTKNYKKRIPYGDYFVKINTHTRSLDLYLTQKSDFPLDSFSKKNVQEIYNNIKTKKFITDSLPVYAKYGEYLCGLSEYWCSDRVIIGCTRETRQKFYSIANKVLKLK